MSDLTLFPESEKLHPSFYEAELRRKGYIAVAGTDEVGRGCLAGPVVAAAVIFPQDHKISGIKDSKLLSPRQREDLFEKIKTAALAWAVGRVESDEIDRINIFQASLKAMVIAIQKLSVPPDFLLLDGRHKLPLFMPQKPVVKGDQHCKSIGAASIMAKVTRDRLMSDFEAKYPHFTFSEHKGYPTAQHRKEILEWGPTPIHRVSFQLLP